MGDLTLANAWKTGKTIALIRAETLGPFAVHETRGSGGWTLTLASCGYAIVQNWPSMDACKTLAEELLRIGAGSSWGEPLDPNPISPSGEAAFLVKQTINTVARRFNHANQQDLIC